MVIEPVEPFALSLEGARKAADIAVRLEQRDLVAGTGKLVSGGQTCKAGADDGDLGGTHVSWFLLDIARGAGAGAGAGVEAERRADRPRSDQ